MRITKQLKEIIVKKAIEKSGILEEFADLRVARAAWAERCRVDALGGAEKAAALETMKSQFEDLLSLVPSLCVRNSRIIREDSNIYLNVAGMRIRARFNGTGGDDEINHYNVHCVYKITPECHTIIGGSPLAIEFDELLAKQRDLNKRHKDMRLQVEAAVSKFTTTEKMIKFWPESAELIPAAVPEVQKTQLPAMLTDELNKMIGLPSGKTNK